MCDCPQLHDKRWVFSNECCRSWDRQHLGPLWGISQLIHSRGCGWGSSPALEIKYSCDGARHDTCAAGRRNCWSSRPRHEQNDRSPDFGICNIRNPGDVAPYFQRLSPARSSDILNHESQSRVEEQARNHDGRLRDPGGGLGVRGSWHSNPRESCLRGSVRSCERPSSP